MNQSVSMRGTARIGEILGIAATVGGAVTSLLGDSSGFVVTILGVILYVVSGILKGLATLVEAAVEKEKEGEEGNAKE